MLLKNNQSIKNKFDFLKRINVSFLNILHGTTLIFCFSLKKVQKAIFIHSLFLFNLKFMEFC